MDSEQAKRHTELLGPIYFSNGPWLSVWVCGNEVDLVERGPNATFKILSKSEPVAAEVLGWQLINAARSALRIRENDERTGDEQAAAGGR